MRDWTPDRDFGRADFKSRKEKEDPDRAVEPKTVPLPQPATKPVALAASMPAQDQVAGAAGGRVITAWRPRNIADAATSVKPETQKRPAPAFERMQPVARSSTERPADDDMSASMMGELVLGRTAEATELLRRWYWDRSNPSSHTRIHIVLRSISKDALVELYRFFTALERRQMHEIYGGQFTIAKNEIMAARREFMEALSG